MNINSDNVVIKNKIIVNFLNIIKDDINLLNAFENTVVSICSLMDNSCNKNVDLLSSVITENITENVNNILEVSSLKIIDNIRLLLNNNGNDEKLINQLNNNLPNIIKGSITNELLNVNSISVKIDNLDRNIQNFHNIKYQTEDISEKVDKLIIHSIREKEDIKLKGERAECDIYDLCVQRFRQRDGYNVSRVNNENMACDILISRVNKPNIRLEIKNYGIDNRRKVDYREVEKFRRDLEFKNDHGIMISLYSDICGINNGDIELMTNNKLAIYLSKNNLNIDEIEDKVCMIYKLDNIIPTDSSILSLESIDNINYYLKEFSKKIDDIKNNLTNSIKLLNDVELDKIKFIINGRLDDNQKSLICMHCNKSFASISNRQKHEKNCNIKKEKDYN